MCRIVGFWDLSFKGDYDIEETIVKMRDTLVHGGPDDAGVFVDVKSGLAFGHRMLSIFLLIISTLTETVFGNLFSNFMKRKM